jgi:hypothetical protein
VVAEGEPDPQGLHNIYDEDLHSSDWNADERGERDKSEGGRGDRVRKRKTKWKELRWAEKERARSSKEVLGFVDKARSRVKELVGPTSGGREGDRGPEFGNVRHQGIAVPVR